MTTTPNIVISEKERVEHTARSAPPPRTRKKEKAKRSRSTDQISKARKKLALTEAKERSILNDPLATEAAAPQNSETDLYTGSGFPPPGLAFYAAQAMSLAVQADANAMDVYSNLEQAQYKMINLAYQRMADSDRSALQSQASASMWSAISQTVMGGITFGGGAYGAYRLGKLANETSSLNDKKNGLTLRLGKIATMDDAEVDEITTKLNEAKASGKPSIATQLREAQAKFDRSIKFQDTLQKFENDFDPDKETWETAVKNLFDDNQDGLAVKLDKEHSDFNQKINERNKLNSDDESKQILERDRQRLEQPFINRKTALEDARSELIKRGSDSFDYEARKSDLTETQKKLNLRLNEKKTEIKRGIDKVDTDLKAKKAEGQKIQSHMTMANGLGQLGQAFNFGKMAAENGQAQYQYQKNKAQQAQTMNEAIRGEIARQWSSLAQAKESAMQEYASTMKSINQSLRA